MGLADVAHVSLWLLSGEWIRGRESAGSWQDPTCSFIQGIFTEYLLHTRHCSECWHSLELWEQREGGGPRDVCKETGEASEKANWGDSQPVPRLPDSGMEASFTKMGQKQNRAWGTTVSQFGTG